MTYAQRQRLGLGNKLAVGAKEALLEKALLLWHDGLQGDAAKSDMLPQFPQSGLEKSGGALGLQWPEMSLTQPTCRSLRDPTWVAYSSSHILPLK